MIGAEQKGTHFGRGLYAVGGTLVVSAITLVLLRAVVGRRVSSSEGKVLE